MVIIFHAFIFVGHWHLMFISRLDSFTITFTSLLECTFILAKQKVSTIYHCKDLLALNINNQY